MPDLTSLVGNNNLTQTLQQIPVDKPLTIITLAPLFISIWVFTILAFTVVAWVLFKYKVLEPVATLTTSVTALELKHQEATKLSDAKIAKAEHDILTINDKHAQYKDGFAGFEKDVEDLETVIRTVESRLSHITALQEADARDLDTFESRHSAELQSVMNYLQNYGLKIDQLLNLKERMSVAEFKIEEAKKGLDRIIDRLDSVMKTTK